MRKRISAALALAVFAALAVSQVAMAMHQQIRSVILH